MIYTYYYQTKTNENRTGTIKARNRADAYTLLRKQGVRPYRIVGDDPFNWRPWAVGAGLALLALVAVVLGIALFRSRSSVRPLAGRRQITGDAQYLRARAIDAWDGVFTTKLDRYLAAYAQPGDAMIPLLASAEDARTFLEDLKLPLERASSDRTEIQQLKDIVEKLREEMRAYLASGGTVGEYLNFLEERQQSEINIRHQAFQTLRRAPESERPRLRREINLRLQGQNLAPMP